MESPYYRDKRVVGDISSVLVISLNHTVYGGKKNGRMAFRKKVLISPFQKLDYDSKHYL
jgi:hypothetical protein